MRRWKNRDWHHCVFRYLDTTYTCTLSTGLCLNCQKLWFWNLDWQAFCICTTLPCTYHQLKICRCLQIHRASFYGHWQIPQIVSNWKKLIRGLLAFGKFLVWNFFWSKSDSGYKDIGCEFLQHDALQLITNLGINCKFWNNQSRPFYKTDKILLFWLVVIQTCDWLPSFMLWSPGCIVSIKESFM